MEVLKDESRYSLVQIKCDCILSMIEWLTRFHFLRSFLKIHIKTDRHLHEYIWKMIDQHLLP